MNSPGWQFLTALLLICGIGIAAYANTLDVPFTFDDEDNIVAGVEAREIGANQGSVP